MGPTNTIRKFASGFSGNWTLPFSPTWDNILLPAL